MITPEGKTRLKQHWEEIVTPCKKCGGTANLFVGGKAASCECLRKYNFFKAMEQAEIPFKFQSASLAEYIDAENVKPKQKLTAYVKALADHKRHGSGLLLQGPYGTGKSYLACALLKEVLRQGFSARFVTLEDLITIFSNSWRDPDARRELEWDIVSVDFLALDECSKRTNVGVDLAKTALEGTFRSRSNDMKPVFMTSNNAVNLATLTGDTTLFGENLISLFSEHLIPVTFAGSDFRPKILEQAQKRLKEQM